MILGRFSLKGKVAIVTGAGRGIGHGIALASSEAGADVVCISRTASQIEETAAELRRIGCRSLAIPCDVCDAEQLEVMVGKTSDEFGHIDILVNNAGGAAFGTLAVASQSSFESDLRTNLISGFLCIKAVAPVMKKQRSGSIVNISSRESNRPALGYLGYGAAKAGVNSITKTLARELAPYVRVNAILPGPILTTANIAQFGPLTDLLSKVIPMKRTGTPEDIALAAIYFASSASDWVTGKLLEVNGGLEFSYDLHQQLASHVEGHA